MSDKQFFLNTSPMNVVAMAPYERGWSNVELVKDCGLIPYLLYKNHNCNVKMVGAPVSDHSYADLIKGVELEYLADGKESTKLSYIRENAKNIDCLILRGCYSSNFNVAKLYKKLNPEGVIYVGLDANSSWMDKILWKKEDFREFMDCCDIIATSCRAMQKHLNEKWSWKIEYIANGYYNFGSVEANHDFERKENVILTVARLGTPQKATDVLMEAFAALAHFLPDWKLKLVGNVEEDFKEYIENYFECCPHLRDRVIFTGSITDRNKLAEEYGKAKIFALPSVLEGGTPNVIAEALHAGCAIAITRVDAYEDATNGGSCGRDAAINDTEGFARILIELCKSENLDRISQEAYNWGRTNYDMEKIVAKLYKMICVRRSL